MKQSRISPKKPVVAARIALVSASWHSDIVVRARDAFLAEAAALGQSAKTIDLYEVPGAFEIPLHAQTLARSGQYDAIVACALVVDGGIYRHEFVAHAVIDGLMRVQLDTGVPVISAVLTPKDFHERADHLKFFSEHFVKKGAEAARASVATVTALRKIAPKTYTSGETPIATKNLATML
jgi:6,7-dimethyl-8-ribityllumazine synthase